MLHGPVFIFCFFWNGLYDLWKMVAKVHSIFIILNIWIIFEI